MAYQVDRRTVVRWLGDHGFERLPHNSTSHDRYRLDGTAGIVSLPNAGPTDLRKCHVSVIIRRLTDMGFNPDTTRTELKTKRWTKSKPQQGAKGKA